MSDQKFEELILYVSRLSEGDENFGATKLNKLLFYIDFAAYRCFGKSVSGEEYMRLPKGPVPRQVTATLEAMEESGLVATRKRERFGFVQNRTFALREPDLDRFSSREVDLIHQVVDTFKGWNATQISDHSHRFAGWELAENGETIPYEMALVGGPQPEISEADKQWCQGLENPLA